jgi:CRISPR/Cas system CMR-associated protein Cmr3 (group 5 of RAMP superfamily)|tara:strand:- start:319 stop:483 length:165 start_codon:yes stop_codon:yes gene_type:complete
MKNKKIIVKTPAYLDNKHTLGQLEKRICLNKKEIAERKKSNPSGIKSDGKAEAE